MWLAGFSSGGDEPAELPPEDVEDEGEQEEVDAPEEVFVFASGGLDSIEKAPTDTDIVPNTAKIPPDFLYLLTLPLEVGLHADGQILHFVGVLFRHFQLLFLVDEFVSLVQLNISQDVLIRRARSANLVVALLSLPHLLADRVEFFLVFLDFFSDEVALSPILGILATLHEIHGLNLHLLKQILSLLVLLGVLVGFEEGREAAGVREERAQVAELVQVFRLVAVQQVERHICLVIFQICYWINFFKFNIISYLFLFNLNIY